MEVVSGIKSSAAAAMAYYSMRCLVRFEPAAMMIVWYHIISR